jgi:hypothetical protein
MSRPRCLKPKAEAIDRNGGDAVLPVSTSSGSSSSQHDGEVARHAARSRLINSSCGIAGPREHWSAQDSVYGAPALLQDENCDDIHTDDDRRNDHEATMR